VAPIVVIRFQPSAPLGIAAHALDESGAEWRYLDVFEPVDWPELDDIGGIIALGGGMNVDRVDEYPFLSMGRGLLVRAVENSVPILGICLGAQMLARALGAEVRPASMRVVGWYEVRSTAAGATDPVLSPFAPKSRVFYFHEDAFELPDGADLLFQGDIVGNQAFRFGTSAYGIQWHLEVTEKIVADWCDETPDLEPAWGVTKAALLKQALNRLPAQQAAGSEAVKGFARLCEARSKPT
jgi:GMP synthase (glutamine-hydrolysing)